jgi:type I restriction enzyme S subunit
MVEAKTKVKRYDTYKYSGVEWLGEIPSHWEVKRFKHIFKEKKITHDVKLNCGSISFGKVVFKDDEKVPVSTKKSYQVLNKGEFLINPLNLNYDLKSLRIGLSDKDVVVSSGYIIVQNVAELSKVYYKWLLHIFDIAFMKTLGSGVRQTLSFAHVANSELVFPPLTEQTKIAQFLDDKTTKIDDAITIKEQQINLLKERKQILIHKAVTQGLNPNVTLKDSGVEWIGKIPKHWEVKKVTHLFDRIGSGTTPTSGDNRYYDGKFNFLQTGDLNDGKILRTKRTLKERAFKEFSSLKIYPKESLVMAMYGATIGKLGILNIESATNQACCVFGKSDKIRTQYFFQVLLAFRTEIISFGYGGGQPNISQDLIKSLRFPIAPLSEQKEISAYIETASQKIETAIGLKEQEIDKLKEYKSSLINSVVTGKVKVC